MKYDTKLYNDSLKFISHNHLPHASLIQDSSPAQAVCPPHVQVSVAVHLLSLVQGVAHVGVASKILMIDI